MGRLHLQGYICEDCDYVISLSPNKSKYCCYDSILAEIERFAETNGKVKTLNPYDDDGYLGLGQTNTRIENVNLRIYVTENECTLEEAESSLIDKLYGVLTTETELEGYSEYTITGLDVNDFSIGGHNLEKEIRSHMGEYMHFVLEC